MDTFFKLNADEAAATVDRYCAATALLPKNVLHNPQTAGGGAALRDAAEFLTPLVSWRGRAGSFQVPPSLTSKLQDAKDTWATAVVPADVAGIDLTWMSQLLDDDVWGVATAGPLVDSATTVSPFETPLPIYASLVEIAKVRYLQALAQGNIAQATREVRHFADLINTNDVLRAELSAVEIVGLEAPFLAAATARGLAPTLSAPLTADQLPNFRHVAAASVAYVFPGVDQAVMQKAIDCSPNPCATIGEAAASHRQWDSASELGDADPFWQFAESRACDKALFRLTKSQPGGGTRAMTKLLGAIPAPLESLFGSGISPRDEDHDP